MYNISRRTFLGGAALTASAFRLPAEAMGIPPGTQTYPFRNEFAKDIPGTLKALAGIGTRRIELCSPWSYREFAGFKDYKPADLKKLLDSNNIVAESCHYGMPEVKSNLDERIAWAKELGMEQMILASMPIPRQNATLADWDRACDYLNKAGEQSLKSGVQIGFHNHNGEFAKIDDALIYDHLMQKLDPKAVKMQFQVSVISIGYKAEDYLGEVRGAVHFAAPARLVVGGEEAGPAGQGRRRVADAVRGGEEGRREELVRRVGVVEHGRDEGQLRVSEDPQKVTARDAGSRALVDGSVKWSGVSGA
jgi:hypothetical protein